MASPVYAETIILKSGEVIKGEITEQGDNYIKVSIADIPLTYYLDEIKNIKESGSSSITQEAAEAKQVKEYGVSLKRPGNWECYRDDTLICRPTEEGQMIEGYTSVIFGSPPLELLKTEYNFNNVDQVLGALIDSYSQLEKTAYATGFELIDKGKTTIDGKPAGYLTYNMDKQGLSKKEYIINGEDRFYSIQFTVTKDEFSKYIEEADFIMKSLELSEN
jgi:hypothetical protein